MKKWYLIPLLLSYCAFGQTKVTPILEPHQTFLNNAGAACSMCSLYTYAGGTTTPLATYTDSTGATQNPNPIVLDIAGGANIWVGSTSVYKFVLIDSTGTTVWTVDNVSSSGGGAVPCSSAGAVQIANSTATALTCDPAITINTTSHALQVGGAITGPAFTLKNLSVIPASWTFDVTTPSTALSSLGLVPLTDIATQVPDTVLMNATGNTEMPTAVQLPSNCTSGINYYTGNHTWSCANTTVSLSNVAAQPADTVVMNATGGSAAPSAIGLPAGCTNGVNYSTASHTWSCTPSYAYNPTDHDVSLVRYFGAQYQNSTSGPLRIYGYGAMGGSSVGSMEVRIGQYTATSTDYANTCSGSVSGGACGFSAEVPAGWYYSIISNTFSGGAGAVQSVGSWHEVY